MLGYMLSLTNKRVLVIDLDPQSNTTQAVMSDEQIASIYDDTNEVTRTKTILDILEPIRDTNEAKIGHVKGTILKSKKHAFLFDLIPSNLQLSRIEDTLSRAWDDVKGSNLGGFRRTNWLNQLLDQIKKQYDYVLIDLSPSLGALNRSVMLNTDYFIVPITGDVYNKYGIRNIGPWISEWLKIYNRGLRFLQDDYSNDVIELHRINTSVDENNFKKLAGVIKNRVKYSKTKSDTVRPISYQPNRKKIISYQSNFFDQINVSFKDAKDGLGFAISNEISDSLYLGEIAEINSLLTEAQGKNLPVVARVVAARVSGDSWDKYSPENAEYAIFQTFNGIVELLEENLTKLESKND